MAAVCGLTMPETQRARSHIHYNWGTLICYHMFGPEIWYEYVLLLLILLINANTCNSHLHIYILLAASYGLTLSKQHLLISASIVTAAILKHKIYTYHDIVLAITLCPTCILLSIKNGKINYNWIS